jgi:isoleucyl-tRNA synthetase
VKEEYFDAEIERQVQRMQAVIDLTRNIRERHNISLKVRSHAIVEFWRFDPTFFRHR